MNLQTQRCPQTIGQLKGRRPSSSLGGSGAGLRIPHSETDTKITVESPVIGHQQRSISVATLQPPVIQPRMAQLETLEAKMASIEVSLSSTPRRKKNGSISGISLSSSIQSIPKELAVKELEKLRNALRDKENIIQSLKGQLTIPGLRLNAIRNTSNNNNNNIKELTEVEKKQAEARLHRLKTDIDNKRLTIKNLKMALERLDITDNIDVRIQQAELEYQLGREELNLLTLLEETRALQLCIEESNKHSSEYHTLYSCVQGNDCVLLQALQIDYDTNNPKFGAGPKESVPGLYVDWALEETNLCKGDRLIEVNGKIVLNKSRDDLNRLLAAAPDPAQIVILRKVPENQLAISSNGSSIEISCLRNELESFRERAEETQKAKEGLKSDNIRLTHRISYLEEQVSELLNRKSTEKNAKKLPPTSMISKSTQNVTNINIRTDSSTKTSSTNPDHQIFQKGNHISAITSDKEQICVPIRSKSSLSNVSNTIISSLNGDYCNKLHSRHKHKSSRNGVQSPTGHDSSNEKMSYRKHAHHHHHHHREKDYSSETNSGVDIRRYNKNTEPARYSTDFAKANSEKEYASDIMDQSYKKATQIVHDLTRSRDSTLYEKHRQKCLTASEKYNTDILKHYNARKSTSVLDFRSEIHIGPKYDSKSVEHIDDNEICTNGNVYRRIVDARSVKSLDFDSDCNSIRPNGTSSNVDYTSEPNTDKKLYYTNGYEQMKPRPTPPKKPLRLSLHKTHSLQSVETNSDCQSRNERKCMKRNYKGENPLVLKPLDKSSSNYQMKWNYRKSFDNTLENGSWC